MDATRGFSTLEILIAMTVLTLTLSAVLLLLPTNQSGLLDTELTRRALAHASQALAQESALAASDFRMVTSTTTEDQIHGITFHTHSTVTPHDFFSERVTADVSWGGWYGKHQHLELSTLLTNLKQSSTCDSDTQKTWIFPYASHVLFGELPGLSDASGLYPLTDIDVYRRRLYATTNLSASSLPAAGPLAPGTITNDPQLGTQTWSTPAHAGISDNQYATAVLATGEATQYLRASQFGFTIPRGATILGIEVAVERKGSSNVSTVKDSVVRIVRADGSLGSMNKAGTANWPTSDSYRTYGSSVDLWNETNWSADAINDSDFGVVLSAGAQGAGGTRSALVDHIRITVTYTKQFYVVNVAGTPELIGGLGQNTVAAGMNAVVVATSTSIGNYAYVALNSSVTHMEVIDVTYPTATVVSTYHIPDASVPASTIFYHQGYAYVGLENNPSGGELAIVDVHNPHAPVLVGTYEVGAGINDLYLHNGILYLATDDSSRELILLTLVNVAHPTLRASYDAPGTMGSGQARTLYVVGNTVHLGRYYSLTTAPEYLAIDVSDAPVTQGSFDAGPSAHEPFGIYGVIAQGAFRYLLTSSTSRGGSLSVLTGNSPTLHTSVTLPHSGGGRALDCEGDTLYAASVPVSGSYTNKGSLSVITSL